MRRVRFFSMCLLAMIAATMSACQANLVESSRDPHAPFAPASVKPVRSAEVEAALQKAGSNRPGLEHVLDHYAAANDPQKLEAAEFLISAMDGRGYDVIAFADAKGVEVPFDALDYRTFKEAEAAMDALEKEHGQLQTKVHRHYADLTTFRQDLLIEQIDWAFKAWREKPWAKAVSFDDFKRYILPYRGSEEPLESWRPALWERFTLVQIDLKDPTDGRAASKVIRKGVDQILGFSELYYLHPTDQSYSEMAQHKLGRCEDITNMCLYAWRANGIPCAMDFTPAWANRDNNHAWEVVLVGPLDTGVVKGSARAAKIYRKEFAPQADALGGRLQPGETAAPRFKSKTLRDVTEQYIPVSEVAVDLSAHPKGQRFAYLCVFNGGEWIPVAWAEVADIASGSHAVFAKMGRKIAYLPAWYVADKVVPAAAPFILDDQGVAHRLDGVAEPDRAATESIELAVVTPSVSDPDTQRDKPTIKVNPGKIYELFVWEGVGSAAGWKSFAKAEARADAAAPIRFNAIPANRLLWMKASGSRNLERIFSVEGGRVVMW